MPFAKDGKAAGQTIPHAHFHILPRRFKDDPFAGRNDVVYPALDRAEAILPQDLQVIQERVMLKVDADECRPSRTIEEMEKEALMLKSVFAAQGA